MLTLKGEDEINSLSKSETKISLPEYVPTFPLILNPFPKNNVSLIQSQDSLELPTGVIDFSFGQKKIDVHVSWDWSLITITETVDDRKLKIPFTSSLEWYFKIMRQKKWHVSFLEIMQNVKKDDGKSRACWQSYDPGRDDRPDRGQMQRLNSARKSHPQYRTNQSMSCGNRQAGRRSDYDRCRRGQLCRKTPTGG